MGDTAAGKPPAPDAWKQAVVNHTSTLTPAQQLQFKSPATVDDCLRILKEHRAQKKAITRVLQFFEPLIETLKRFEGAIDVIVQVNTGIGSPIWGPLRVAVTIASDHFRTLEHLALVIDRIASSIKRYHDFEVLFRSHSDVRNAIGALYADLICFCAHVVRFHTRPFRYLFVTFDKEFGTIWQSIEFHSNEVHRAASLAYMKDEKDMRDKMELDKQIEISRQIQCWLSPSTVEDDLQRHLAEHMPGSSDWATFSTKFVSWLNGKSNESLQITGRPGSGKSTLAAFLVDYLSSIRSTVLFFFCDGSDSEKREKVHVLRTLLAQLARGDPGVQSHLLPRYQKGRAVADSSFLVYAAFKDVMKRQQENDIYIVIDAVDECEGSASSMGLLDNLQSITEATRAKVAITTRAQDGRSAHWSATYELTMKPEFSSRHLREYVSGRVQKLEPIASTDSACQIIDQIAEAADGLWLYGRLMVDDIERAPSMELVKRRLGSLPRGLSELYSQVLRSCEERMTTDEQEFAKHLYMWLDISGYMPSSWAGNFDRLPYRTLELLFRYVNGGGEVFDAATLARKLGTPLIEPHPVDSSHGLQFVHSTAYKYLAESSKQPYDELPAVLKPQRLNPLYKGMTAVWYFSECPDSERQLECLRDPSELGDYFSFDTITSYFEMTYGLLSAFRFTSLPGNLAREEREFVRAACRRLSVFLRSGQVLRYFEMATIINYSGDYIQLLDNVLESLEKTREKAGDESVKEFEEFRRHSEEFFLAWAYILCATTPWVGRSRISGPRASEKVVTLEMQKPRNFDENLVSREMMIIAERWRQVFFSEERLRIIEDRERVSREAATAEQCPYCSGVIPPIWARKHGMAVCPAIPKSRKWLRMRADLCG